jgi:NTP pyrophosphatase (non-canonical NTP hydrolase)
MRDRRLFEGDFMSWNDLEMKVIRWAEARKIIPNATPSSQLLKAVSELGELCDAEGKRDQDAIQDAVGDVLVCLINYCALRDISIVKCLGGAYDQIKDRKGTLMPDGTFVKDVEK